MTRATNARRTGLAVAALACAAAAGAPISAGAQPEPSFRPTCADLRRSVQKLGLDDERLVVIQVVGPLTKVHFDGTLAYMFMCSPPDPDVLCVTYATSGRKAGDVVVLSGSYSPRGPDHILLDPCLHSPPDQADPK